MRTPCTIKCKEEACDYLYKVYNNIEEATPVLIEQAKTYFEPGELASTLFIPPHIVDECFRAPNNECSCEATKHNDL